MSQFLTTLSTLFKRYFVAGLIVLIPVVATIWILRAIIVYADSMFTGLLPERLQPEALPGTAEHADL